MFLCISRPRRSGKSVAAKMLYAYYDRKSVEARPLFENLEIARQPDFEKHLNKYPVIFVDFNTFAEVKKEEVVTYFQKKVIEDLKLSYPFLKEDHATKRQEIALDALTDAKIEYQMALMKYRQAVGN